MYAVTHSVHLCDGALCVAVCGCVMVCLRDDVLVGPDCVLMIVCCVFVVDCTL